MPYTKQELDNVDFYQDFKKDLRNRYKDEMKKVVLPSSIGWTNSRKDGVLYSFEHYLDRTGIESANVGHNEFHDFLEGEDEEGEFDAREGQYSKTEKLYPRYSHGKLLNRVIDREISELLPPTAVGSSLPDRVKNGDRVAVATAFDAGIAGDNVDVWLIEDDKKRKYETKFAFFTSPYSKSTIKLISQSDIDSIVDGETIQIGWKTSTEGSSNGRF